MDTIEDRFWSKVDVGGVCWEWTGASQPKGYGNFSAGGKTVGAHRWAWEHLVGPIPKGMQLDHLCRNRPCVNPDHLEVVTPAENIRRAANSRKTHCPKNHPYSGSNLYARPDRRGRGCNACKAESVIKSRGTRRSDA